MFDATTEFETSLEEIRLLLNLAIEKQKNSSLYDTILKSCVVLIASKIEVYVETVFEEFIYGLNEKELPSNKIPKELKFYHTVEKFPEVEILKNHNKIDKNCNIFLSMAKVWSNDADFVKIEINSKFNYGKHGEKEIVNLFKKIGINNILDGMIIETNIEDVYADETETIIAKDKINELIGIRNNILHTSANPAITDLNVKNYINLCKSFCEKIDNILQDRLLSIQ